MKKNNIFSIILSIFIVTFTTSITFAANIIEYVGENRFETAIKVSKNNWNNSNNVVIVNSNAISDSLAAVPFAKSINAPILLCKNNQLDKNTLNEIIRLGAKDIYFIGGESVISQSVLNNLNSKGFNSKRIFGKNREETSLAIAKKLSDTYNLNDIFIVDANKSLPEIACISSVSSKFNIPIIYINSNADIDLYTSFLKSNHIKNSYIIGDKSILPSNLETQLPNQNIISGTNSNDISAKILNKFYNQLYLDTLYVVKDGSNNINELIDASFASVLSGKYGYPTITVGNKLSLEQFNYLNGKYVNNIIQIGGNGNENVIKDINSFIYGFSSGSSITTTPNYITTTPNYITTTPNYITTTPNYITTTPNYITTTPNYITNKISYPYLNTHDSLLKLYYDIIDLLF